MTAVDAVAGVVDAQVHAWAPDGEYPWHIDYPDEDFSRSVREHFSHDIFTWERVIAAMDEVGVEAAVLVSPTLYAGDPSYVLSAVAASPGRLAIVNPVTPNIDDVADAIAELSRHPSVIGIRISAFDDEAFESLRTGEREATAIRAAAEHGLVVNLYTPGYTAALGDLLARFPETQFVVDHLGLPQPPMLALPEDPFAGLDRILLLARLPNVAIKASAVPSLSREGFPYGDVREPLERTLEAFGVERVLWGSDFTRVADLLTYRDGLQYLFEWEGLSAAERAALLGGSARAIYGWPWT